MPGSLATVGDLTSRHQMIGRVRRRPAHLLLSEITFAGAPTSSVGGPARLLLSEISFAGAPASPVGGPARLLLSWISSAVVPASPVGGPRASFSPGFRSLALRHLPPPAAGRCKPEKENQRSSELDADFLFRFAERRRFELLIPFWSIHAFQACLLSHSSISPELPCNTDRAANIRIIC